MRPTKRAPDKWDSARFTSLFLTSGLYCSQTESSPAHLRVTQAVVTLIILMLVACKPANVSVPIKTAEPTLLLPDSIATNFPTETMTPKEKPTLSSTNTPAPTLLIPAPDGVIYRTDTELWRIEKEGTPHLIYQFPKGNVAFLSPDNTHIFYLEYPSTNQNAVTQSIIDLSTLNKTLIYPRDNLNICLFTWMPGQSNIIYTVLLPDGADPGYSCDRGAPVFLSANGNNLIVLDEEGSGWSSPAISPNGEYVAFDKNGEPWLYEWGKSAFPFDTNHYNNAQSGETYFLSPSWSPDSNQLAWIKVQKMQEEEQREIVIFDIKNNTFTSLSLCDAESIVPCGLYVFEGNPHIAWSGDGAFLSVVNYGLDSYGIYSLDGLYERMFDDRFYTMEWSPTDSWYARVETTETCLEVFVESSDGKDSHQIGCGRVLKWSPDGSKLIFGEKEHGWWLVDIKTWSINQIDIPKVSKVTDWISLSVQE